MSCKLDPCFNPTMPPPPLSTHDDRQTDAITQLSLALYNSF